LAQWAEAFLGCVDRICTTFQLPPIPVESNGAFRLLLPNFANDSASKRWGQNGEWQFMVRDLGTGNVLARLRPADSNSKGVGIAVQSSYPEVVKFTAVAN
jgi:hypothetical protein